MSNLLFNVFWTLTIPKNSNHYEIKFIDVFTQADKDNLRGPASNQGNQPTFFKEHLFYDSRILDIDYDGRIIIKVPGTYEIENICSSCMALSGLKNVVLPKLGLQFSNFEDLPEESNFVENSKLLNHRKPISLLNKRSSINFLESPRSSGKLNNSPGSLWLQQKANPTDLFILTITNDNPDTIICSGHCRIFLSKNSDLKFIKTSHIVWKQMFSSKKSDLISKELVISESGVYRIYHYVTDFTSSKLLNFIAHPIPSISINDTSVNGYGTAFIQKYLNKDDIIKFYVHNPTSATIVYNGICEIYKVDFSANSFML